MGDSDHGTGYEVEQESDEVLETAMARRQCSTLTDMTLYSILYLRGVSDGMSGIISI